MLRGLCAPSTTPLRGAVRLPRFTVEERSCTMLLLTRAAKRNGGGGSARDGATRRRGRKATAAKVAA